MGEGRRLLIVGGLGYLGARLAEELTEFDAVVVTGRTRSEARDAWLARQGSRVGFAAFDSRRQRELPVAGEFEVVLNLALPSAAAATKDPEGSREAALTTSRACLHLLAGQRAERLIHFSTFHVYGASDRPEFRETDEPRPQHAYGMNHLACERLIAETTTARPAFILRATNVVGAPAHGELGDQAKLLFLDLCRQAVRDQRLTLNNDGRSYRDFVPMADVVQAVRRVLAADPAKAEAPMNLSLGRALRLDALAETIRERAAAMLGAAPDVCWGEGRDSWRAPFAVANERLRTLGWEPRGEFGAEIDQTLAFFARSQ